MDYTYLLIPLAICLGAMFQTSIGFGSALVSMPLLTLVLPPHVAAPMQIIIAMLLAFWVLYLNRYGLHLHEARRLILASLLGLPAGIALLKFGAPQITLLLLALLLIFYPLYALIIEPRLATAAEQHDDPEAETKRWGSYIAGFAAGILGGAYATNGPPIVVYGGIRRWDKEKFRAVLQTFFLVNDILIVIGHAASGLTTAAVLKYVLIGLPALPLGVILGMRIDRFLHPARFRPVLLTILLLVGIWMLANQLLLGA